MCWRVRTPSVVRWFPYDLINKPGRERAISPAWRRLKSVCVVRKALSDQLGPPLNDLPFQRHRT